MSVVEEVEQCAGSAAKGAGSGGDVRAGVEGSDDADGNVAQGGAGMGYARAGFEITGVDVVRHGVGGGEGAVEVGDEESPSRAEVVELPFREEPFA